VINELSRWLDGQNISPAIREKIASSWQIEEENAKPEWLLEQLTATVAMVHAEAQQLAALCSSPSPPPSISPVAWLEAEGLSAVVKHNLRLVYGRWLAQHAFYDEALEQIGGLTPQDVVDPATLLFYQSVVHHRLLRRQECLESISLLLQNPTVLQKGLAG
jgi:hypothetical protein